MYANAVDFSSGNIRWCGHLDPSNVPFVKQCDGLFTDYCWRLSTVSNNIKALEAIEYDENEGSEGQETIKARKVFVGVDVWARKEQNTGRYEK